METPAATDTVSVTNEEFYTAADGIVKISTEYKGETHTGYYLFDEEGILVTGQAEVKEKSSADEEPTSDAAQSAGEDAAGEETVRHRQSFRFEARSSMLRRHVLTESMEMQRSRQ